MDFEENGKEEVRELYRGIGLRKDEKREIGVFRGFVGGSMG